MPEEAAVAVPETLVIEAPLEEPIGPGDTRPRDETGRFIKPGETPAADETAENDATEQAGDETPPVVAAPVGLDLEDDAAPVYGHDGKFVGGRFVGKYETIDDALVGHRAALKRIGQLEYELGQRRDGTVAPVDALPIVDPEDVSPEQLEDMIDKALGEPEEMTFEERVQYEENPTRYLARQNAKRESVRTQVLDKAADVVTRTKAAYAKVWDTANPHGQRVWADIKASRMSAPEIRVLLGLGLMAREGMLSGNEPVTKRVPAGRAPVTTAAVPAPAKGSSDPRGEQKDAIKRMQAAAYG